MSCLKASYSWQCCRGCSAVMMSALHGHISDSWKDWHGGCRMTDAWETSSCVRSNPSLPTSPTWRVLATTRSSSQYHHFILYAALHYDTTRYWESRSRCNIKSWYRVLYWITIWYMFLYTFKASNVCFKPFISHLLTEVFVLKKSWVLIGIRSHS